MFILLSAYVNVIEDFLPLQSYQATMAAYSQKPNTELGNDPLEEEGQSPALFMTMAQPRWWCDLSGSHCWVERIEYLDLVDLHLGHLRVVDLTIETVQILLTSQTKLKLSPTHKCNTMQCNAIVFKLPQPLCHFRIQRPQHLFWTISQCTLAPLVNYHENH